MKISSHVAFSTLLAAIVALAVAGCHKQPDVQTVDAAQDPAAVNLADASSTAATPAAAAPAAKSSSSSAPVQSARVSQATYQPEQLEADETPEVTAPAPPPELPQYQQPPCPGDGYMWTPGYWNYQPTGYYWVPGAWVRAPYEGALWTPGYWAFRANRYVFFHGHWGRHIGYYGGINYGFGYVGAGYEGGYWNGPAFHYNRIVNNINPVYVHNVYDYRVANPDRGPRFSFNGGHGVQAPPRPSEFVEFHEPRALPMNSQRQHEIMAQRDRSQFAGQGHPGRMAADRGLDADRDVRPVQREQLQGGRPGQHTEPQHGQPSNPHFGAQPQHEKSAVVHPGAQPQHVQPAKPAGSTHRDEHPDHR